MKTFSLSSTLCIPRRGGSSCAFLKGLANLDYGRQGTCVARLWPLGCSRGSRMQAHRGVPISVQHVPRAAVLGLHPDSCSGDRELWWLDLPKWDSSETEALNGIPEVVLSELVAEEASNPSSCLERPGPSPVNLDTDCQIGQGEGK